MNKEEKKEEKKEHLINLLLAIKKDGRFILDITHFVKTENELDKIIKFIENNNGEIDEHDVLYEVVKNSVPRINATRK